MEAEINASHQSHFGIKLVAFQRNSGHRTNISTAKVNKENTSLLDDNREIKQTAPNIPAFRDNAELTTATSMP